MNSATFKTQNPYSEILGQNPNKRELPASFISDMKARSLSPRFNETTHYIQTLQASPLYDGNYLYEFPLLPLKDFLGKFQLETLNVCMPLLKELLDTGYFLYFYKIGRKKFSGIFRRLLNNGEVWDPWRSLDKPLYTVDVTIRKHLKALPTLFKVWPFTKDQVEPQMKFGTALVSTATFVSCVAAGDYTSMADNAVVHALLATTVFAGTGALGYYLGYKRAKQQTVVAKAYASIKGLIEQIKSATLEDLGTNAIVHVAAFLGVTVVGYVLYRTLIKGIFSFDFVNSFISSEYGAEVNSEVIKQLQPGEQVTPHADNDDVHLSASKVALVAIAASVGIPMFTILRNYSTCGFMLGDIKKTFSMENIKRLINWLAECCCCEEVFTVQTSFDEVEDLEEFLSRPNFHRDVKSKPEVWRRLMSYKHWDIEKSDRVGWGTKELSAYHRVLTMLRKAITSYSGCNPMAKDRTRPVSVLLFGAPGIGKTTVCRYIAKTIHTCCGAKPRKVKDIIYETVTGNFPFEGYDPEKHTVIFEDDFLQNEDKVTNGARVEQLYKQLEYSPVILDTAFEDKGSKYYRALGHIFTTNQHLHERSTNAGVMDISALLRRFNLYLEVKQTKEDMSNLNDAWKFREIHNLKKYKYHTDGNWFGFDRLIELVEQCCASNMREKPLDDVDNWSPPVKKKSTSTSSSSSDESSEDEIELVRPQFKTRIAEMYKRVSATYDKIDAYCPGDRSLRWYERNTSIEVVVDRKGSQLDLKKISKDLTNVRYQLNLPEELLCILGDYNKDPRNSLDDAKNYTWKQVVSLNLHYDGKKSTETALITTLGEVLYARSAEPFASGFGKNKYGGPAVVVSSDSAMDTKMQHHSLLSRLFGVGIQTVGTLTVVAMLYGALHLLVAALKTASSSFSFLKEEQVEEQSAGPEYDKGKTAITRVKNKPFRVCSKCHTKYNKELSYCSKDGSALGSVVVQSLEEVEPHSQDVKNDNTDDIERKVMNNVWRATVHRKGGYVSEDYILMADNSNGFVAYHSYDDIDSIERVTLRRGDMVGVIVDRAGFILTKFADHHTAVLTLKTTRLPHVRSIRKLLPKKDTIILVGDTVNRGSLIVNKWSVTVDHTEGTMVADTYARNYRVGADSFPCNYGIVTDIMDNRKGMCGTPYFAQDPADLKYKCMYIHVAADSRGASLASCISLDMLPDVPGEVVENQNLVYADRSCQYPIGTTPSGKIDTYYYVSNKSQYVPSDFRTCFPEKEIETHFPLLGESSYKAVAASTRFEYHNEVCIPEDIDSFVKSNIDELTKYVCPWSHCKELTIEEAIFGNDTLDALDMNTSTGPTWRKWGITDRHLLWDKELRWIHPRLVESVKALHLSYESGVWEEFIVMLALKDEPLPHSKTIKRVFYIYDVHVLIFMRMVLGDLFSSQLRHHNLSGCAIGTNPHGVDWTLLAHRLNKYPMFWATDFSKLDVTMKERIFSWCSLYVKRRYSAKGALATKISGIFAAVCCPTLISANNAFRAVLNTSGWLLTLFINDFACHITHQVIFSIISLSNGYDPWYLRDQACLVSYGDDMIKSVSHEFTELVSPEDFATYMKHLFGMTITGVDKKDSGKYVTRIEDVEFIGRTFQLKGDIYLAPLLQKSYDKMISWIRKSSDLNEQESYQAIFNTMCYEAVPKGKNFYKNLLKRTRKLCEKHKIKPLFATYSLARSTYLDNYVNCPKSERALWFALSERIERREGRKA